MQLGVKKRQEIERKLVSATMTELLRAGYKITVNDGEEDVVSNSTHPGEIMDAVMSTDEDYFFVTKKGAQPSFVRFIYGNDGPDVINDYGVSLEEVLKPVNELADKLQDEYFG